MWKSFLAFLKIVREYVTRINVNKQTIVYSKTVRRIARLFKIFISEQNLGNVEEWTIYRPNSNDLTSQRPVKSVLTEVPYSRRDLLGHCFWQTTHTQTHVSNTPWCTYFPIYNERLSIKVTITLLSRKKTTW